MFEGNSRGGVTYPNGTRCFQSAGMMYSSNAFKISLRMRGAKGMKSSVIE
jgi:hypothetical protein